MLEIAEAEPAILLRHRDAVQAELAHLRPQLGRKPVFLIDARGKRRNAIGGEALGGVADGVGHLAEGEVEPDIGHAKTLLLPGALAEACGFEQGGADGYVRHNPLIPSKRRAKPRRVVEGPSCLDRVLGFARTLLDMSGKL